MNQRNTILALLNGQRPADVPAFSGLLHVTAQGLERAGLDFRAIHHDAAAMARAAASTFRYTGMPSAALPLDLCAPAEALGAELSFDQLEFNFPQVKKTLVESASEIAAHYDGVLERGRLPLILEAIRLTKAEIGDDVVVSGMIPGPYTLLLYVSNPTKLFMEMKKDPQSVAAALASLSAVLAQIGGAYRAAGADFITVHEMGGSPGFVGPARFEQLVLPALQSLMANLPAPRVLSICGNVTRALPLLTQTGAQALSLDQTVDLAVARAALPDTLLFGNLDPLGALLKGDAAEVHAAGARAREAGVDALWPGCDLHPRTPIENLSAMQG